jgi:uracil-DNA glycosylase family 4
MICPRLIKYREKVARERKREFRNWTYWGKPVPGFGDHNAKIVIIGLAPAAHGANRTGRMFTGDGAGSFLTRVLYRAGFANKPTSEFADDGLCLKDVYLTAAIRCAPPKNKPTRHEIENCRRFLRREFEILKGTRAVLTLGRIGFQAYKGYLLEKGVSPRGLRFTHGASYELGEGLPYFFVSYHPSRQNTQTGKLTEKMFDNVITEMKSLIEKLNLC